MKNIPINLRYASLGPSTAPRIVLIDNGINHISFLEFLTPFLISTAKALQLILRYLVVVVVED
jgi:hypothetical protein